MVSVDVYLVAGISFHDFDNRLCLQILQLVNILIKIVSYFPLK